jgi:hypothetical protein
MIGEFGSVTGPVSAPRTAEGVTGDINFTGIENLSGTPRPDVRTPEQIENNSGLRTTTNFTGIENLSGTPRPDLRTPEQIENNERLRR